jgi:hypothetical protein
MRANLEDNHQTATTSPILLFLARVHAFKVLDQVNRHATANYAIFRGHLFVKHSEFASSAVLILPKLNASFTKLSP